MKNIRFALAILLLGFSALSLTACGSGSDSSTSPSNLTSISTPPVVPVGFAQQITATGTFSDSSTHDISTSTLVTWSSSDTTKATIISNTGVVTALSAGSTVLVAQTQSNFFPLAPNIQGGTTLLVFP